MDKNMLYRDFADSAGADRYFTKTITPFSDKQCDEYMNAIQELESEGKITMTECRIKDTLWDKMIVAKGYIV